MSKKNLKVVVYCFVVATTFWFLNEMNKRHQTSVKVHLDYEYDPIKYLEVEEPTDYIEVGLEGSGWDLLITKLHFNRIKVYYPRDGAPISSVVVQKRIGKLFEGLETSFLGPKKVKSGLDKVYFKEVSVYLPKASVPRFDTRIVTGLKFDPPTLALKGPRSNLFNLKAIPVKITEVRLDDDLVTFTTEPDLAGLPKTQVSKKIIQATATAKLKSFIFKKIALSILDSTDQYKLSSDTLSLTFFYEEENVTADVQEMIPDALEIELTEKEIKDSSIDIVSRFEWLKNGIVKFSPDNVKISRK